MLMNTAMKGSNTTIGVDRKKADTIARRIAKAARTRAIELWSQGQYRDFFRSEQEFVDFAYDYSYKTALRKAIAKQKARKSGYRFFLV
jgi:hypothetical protein